MTAAAAVATSGVVILTSAQSTHHDNASASFSSSCTIKEQASSIEKNISNDYQSVQCDCKYQHQRKHKYPKVSKLNQTYAQKIFNSEYKSSEGGCNETRIKKVVPSLMNSTTFINATTTNKKDYSVFQKFTQNILGNDSYVQCDGESSSKTSKNHNVDGNITFRQRRLTLNTSDGEHQDQDTEKDVTIKSEREGIYKEQHQQIKEEKPSPLIQEKKVNIRPRVMYSTEFEKSRHSSSPTYSTTSTTTATATAAATTSVSSVTQNQLLLPFPPHQVGTYSCHGVEPYSYLVYTKSEKPIDGKAYSFFDKIFGTKSTSNYVAPKHVHVSQKKINQDRGNIIYPFGTSESSSINNNHNHDQSQPHNKTALFGVFDGHGQCGQMIAEYTMNAVSVKLLSHPNYPQEGNLEDSNVEQAFKDIFQEIDDETLMNEKLKSKHSGTTACVILLQGNNVWVANVGDSRAVAARRAPSATTSSANSGRKMLAIDWSKDQNVNDEVERLRVIQSGGFVTISQEEGLPSRIWLDKECSQIGLAMSRSVGDHALKHVGVISEPTVKKFEVTNEDEFFILATDGVWEFISSNEAVSIIQDCFDKGMGANDACEVLIKKAMEQWKEIEGDYRDDITAIIVRLQDLWDQDQD